MQPKNATTREEWVVTSNADRTGSNSNKQLQQRYEVVIIRSFKLLFHNILQFAFGFLHFASCDVCCILLVVFCKPAVLHWAPCIWHFANCNLQFKILQLAVCKLHNALYNIALYNFAPTHRSLKRSKPQLSSTRTYTMLTSDSIRKVRNN